MVRFRTNVCKNWFGRPKLVISSSHETIHNKLTNMFSGQGEPMLDVGDAIELRALLDLFIKEQAK